MGSSSDLGPLSALCGRARQAIWARGQLTGVTGRTYGPRQDVHRERDPRHFLLVCLTHLAGAQRLAAPCKSKTKSESTNPEKEGQSNSQLTAKAWQVPGPPPNPLSLGNMSLGEQEVGEAARTLTLDRRLPKKGPQQSRGHWSLSNGVPGHPMKVVSAWEMQDQESGITYHSQQAWPSGTVIWLAQTRGL